LGITGVKKGIRGMGGEKSSVVFSLWVVWGGGNSRERGKWKLKKGEREKINPREGELQKKGGEGKSLDRKDESLGEFLL